jgi:hypothetical protein
MLVVSPSGMVTEILAPRTVDADVGALRLQPRHRDFASAGNAQGRRLTGYQEARERVVEYVAQLEQPVKFAALLRRCQAERWGNELARDLGSKIAGVELYRRSGIRFVRRVQK